MQQPGNQLQSATLGAASAHLVVPVDQVDHVLDDRVARRLRSLAHHAEVQVHEVAGGGGQEVARVRVCAGPGSG